MLSMKKLLLSALCISSLATTATYSANDFANQEWRSLVGLMQKWHDLSRNKWLHKEASTILLKKYLQEDLKKLATLSNASEYQQELSSILKEQKTKISNKLCNAINSVAIAGPIALTSGIGFLTCLAKFCNSHQNDEILLGLAAIVLLPLFMGSFIATLENSGDVRQLQKEKTFLKDFISFAKEQEQKILQQKNILPNAA